MATFAELQNTADSASQVRKALAGVAFLAPIDAAPITSITDTDGTIKPFPAEYVGVGLVSSDGYSFGGDTETAEVTALGYSSPVRKDITSRTREVSFTALEVYRRQLLELVYGVDLSEVVPGPNGEITFDHPTLPEKREYRLVIVAKDGSGANEVYRAKFFPRVSMTSIPEETWNAEDAISYEIALEAHVDDELGTSERDFVAGPGANTAGLGFTA